MSSHHIVREKQEPALYIHELGFFDEEYLGQLLEWNPTLIVNAAIYEKIISLGLKVDIVLNSVGTNFFQENTKSITGTGDEYEVVLNHLIFEKYPAINIIDTHKKLADLSWYLSKINIVLFTATEKTYAIKTGFSVWKPKGYLFLMDVTTCFESHNLKQNEKGEFEVINDGFVEFNFTMPYLVVSEVL